MWYGTGEDSTPIAQASARKGSRRKPDVRSDLSQPFAPAFERSDCDWELGIEELRGIDIVSFLLPEFQDSRQIARMMVLRTRLAIAEHRYDDAIAQCGINIGSATMSPRCRFWSAG